MEKTTCSKDLTIIYTSAVIIPWKNAVKLSEAYNTDQGQLYHKSIFGRYLQV